MHTLIRLFILSLIPFSLIACNNATNNKNHEEDTADNDSVLSMLQGIWMDEETGIAFFKVDGDSIFYPDNTNIPVKISANKDSLTFWGREIQQYPIERLSHDQLYFYSATGTLVCLRKSEDSNDTLYFSQEPLSPIIYQEVVEKDTIVYSDGTRYRCYIYVNPSKYKVYKQSFNNEGIGVENLYYDNVIHLCIYQGKECLYSKDYTRKSFAEVVPENFLEQAILADMKYQGVNNGEFMFQAYIGTPEDASYYVANICISKKGEEKILTNE